MTHYRATFFDGSTKEIKNSKREYRFAWRVWGTRYNGEPRVVSGFSSRDAKLAEASAISEARMQLDIKRRIDGRVVRDEGSIAGVEVVPAEIVKEVGA